jgi:hypothetical protein
MAVPPGDPWNQLFDNVGGQGAQFDKPLSPTNQYYGFLSNVDLADGVDPNIYDLLFEVVPKEWVDNAVLSSPVSIDYRAPECPTSLYHVPAAGTRALLGRLGLASVEELAEGSWYLLTLVASTESDDVEGNLYDPFIGAVST